jgi:hypothetical protein
MLRHAIVIGFIFALGLGVTARAEEKEADEKVILQLDRKVPAVNFTGQGLADVIDLLRDITRANIFVNWRALEAAGINKDAKVAIQLKDAKFRDLLKGILDKVGTENGKATFTVQEGLIVISSVPDPKHPRDAVTVAKIPAKLDRNMPEINFNGQGLADVIDFLRDVSGMKIDVDWPALEHAGIGRDSPVITRVRDLRFSTVMRFVFEDVGDGKVPIDCTFMDNVLKVTAKPAEPNKADK